MSRGGSFQTVFAFLLKRSLLSKEIICPHPPAHTKGDKFFLFTVELFSEGNCVQETKQIVINVVSLAKYLPDISSIFKIKILGVKGKKATKCKLCLKISSFRKQAFWRKFDQNRLRNKNYIVFYLSYNLEQGRRHFE